MKQALLPLPAAPPPARRGRPRKPDAGASHLERPVLAARFPVHVTVRLLPHIPNLRELRRMSLLERCFAAGKERFGFRLVHYAVMGNHIHLLVEAKDARALSRGMKGLSVRIAKRLNRHLGTKGRVVEDRYHAHILRTPREVKNALAYVLCNGARHAARAGRRAEAVIDACSSGRWFDGWASSYPMSPFTAPTEVPVTAPRTWLLRVGWRKHGLVRAGTG